MSDVYCPICICWIVGEQESNEPIVQCPQCGTFVTKVEVEQFALEV